MKTLKLEVSALQIPLKESFKHSSADRSVGESIWVKARRGELSGFGEGCPRVYVTGETLESSFNWAKEISKRLSDKNISSLDDIRRFVSDQEQEIDHFPAAWCAIELALLDLIAQESRLCLEELLGVSTKRKFFRYTAILSADDEQKFEKRLRRYASFAFTDFKIKVMADENKDYVRLNAFKNRFFSLKSFLETPLALLARIAGARLRYDANNGWANHENDLDKFLELAPIKAWAIEEPFAPNNYEAMSALSVNHKLGIILDESLKNRNDLENLKTYKGEWIPNIRVSKVGGLIRGLELVKLAKDQNLRIIIGAQVGETSVLSRAALVLARAAGANLIAQEGAFGELLISSDPVTPVIQFGMGALLYHNPKNNFGSGLKESLA